MNVFAISDSADTPEDAKDLVHLGSITLQQHMAARGFWEKAEPLGLLIHPFEDTRLFADQTKHLAILASENHAQRDLLSILSNAMNLNSGIMIFTD